MPVLTLAQAFGAEFDTAAHADPDFGADATHTLLRTSSLLLTSTPVPATAITLTPG